MAVFCLARDLDDLEARLGRMIVAYTRAKRPVTAADIKAPGAMTVLLKDALRPNLVQTLEGNPALVHGGPFANIAHGCNSIVATRAGLKLADYVVTEAGFGADLGAEKFFDIKCRAAGLKPAACVIVATVRALKFNGGAAKAALGVENLAALAAGLPNLERHIANVGKFGVPVVVAINRFASDTEAELELIRATVQEKFGVEAIVCDHWAQGGQGAEELARAGRRARRPTRRRASGRSMTIRRRSGTRSGQSRRKSTAPPTLPPIRRSASNSNICRRRAMARCPSASPRRPIPSPPIRACSARRAAISRRSANCASAPAPALSSSCSATS